jgi:small-conductance mechanosensitive channel
LVFIWLLKLVLAKYFFWLDRRKEGELFHLIGAFLKSLSVPLVVIVALYAASQGFDFDQDVEKWLAAVAVIAVIIQLARWGNVVITFWVERYQRRHAPEETERLASLHALAFIGRLFLITLALLLALDNIPGVEITTLIAGLGIGGIAVAIAVQNTLSDLFGSLSIILDKPFVNGDFIVIDSYMGTVEHIGLKTTRIRSLSGEQLIFSNTDLLKSRIRNYKRMAERRVVFSINIVYQTSYRKLQRIPVIIREIINQQENVRFDRVHFQNYGDFALIFEIVYYVLNADYAVYMDVQQSVNLEIFKRFEQEDIIFAYPTRTIYLVSHSENHRMNGNNPNHAFIDTADP